MLFDIPMNLALSFASFASTTFITNIAISSYFSHKVSACIIWNYWFSSNIVKCVLLVSYSAPRVRTVQYVKIRKLPEGLKSKSIQGLTVFNLYCQKNHEILLEVSSFGILTNFIHFQYFSDNIFVLVLFSTWLNGWMGKMWNKKSVFMKPLYNVHGVHEHGEDNNDFEKTWTWAP